jgi:hypothetical protein
MWFVPRRTFLTVPLSGGNEATSPISEHVERGVRDLSPGRFVWAPSRRFNYFEAGSGDAQNIWRVTVDARTGKWVAGPEPLTTGPGDATDIALSPDGKRLLVTTISSRTRLWAFPFDVAAGHVTGEPLPVTDGSTGLTSTCRHPTGPATAAQSSVRAVFAGPIGLRRALFRCRSGPDPQARRRCA